MRQVTIYLFFIVFFVTPAAWSAPGANAWSMWVQSDETNQSSIQHDDWGDFLDRYVIADATNLNRVAYKAVSDADRQNLDAYIERLGNTDPRKFSKNEQFAYWINLYNALTVQVVLDNPDEKSIRDMGDTFFAIGPWSDELISVAGQPLTLDNIEHRILRPIWQDHRIHFAVNCASIGCPNLADEPYTAAKLQRMLSEAERSYINHDRGVRFDDKGRLQLSQIFEWYVDDFAASEAELLQYLGKHHDEFGDRVQSYDGHVRYDYSWLLNGADPS